MDAVTISMASTLRRCAARATADTVAERAVLMGFPLVDVTYCTDQALRREFADLDEPTRTKIVNAAVTRADVR